MRTRTVARFTATTILAAFAAAVLAHVPEAWAQPGCGGSHWVGAWATSPTDARPGGFQDQTLRMVVTPHHGGSRVRVRLTNRFGARPVRFERVNVAVRKSGAELVPGSGRALAFARRREVTIEPGGSVVSDPVDLRFAAFQDLAVSMYAARATGPATQHVMARQTSFVSAPGRGDHTADEAPDSFAATTSSWSFLEAVEVVAPKRTGAAVAFGDSITDGFRSQVMPGVNDPGPVDRNERYPDFLARRLLRAGGPDGMSVLNAGITGNRVLLDKVTRQSGRRAPARIDHDVLAAAGVTDVILLEGINDLREAPRSTPAALIAGLERMVGRLRAAGLNVVLGTLPPAGSSKAADASRQRVNDWIRTRGVAVVDFDAALRDPADRSRLRRRYDSGDHLHPNSAGYRAMADAVDLWGLRGTRCDGRRRTTLSVGVRPRRHARPAHSLAVRGRLSVRPGGRGRCPRGLVRVEVSSGPHPVASRSARLRGNCRFTLALRQVGARPPRGPRRLLIRAWFDGTRTLRPTTSQLRRPRE